MKVLFYSLLLGFVGYMHVNGSSQIKGEIWPFGTSLYLESHQFIPFWIYSITELEDNGYSCSVRYVRRYTQINILLAIQM